MHYNNEVTNLGEVNSVGQGEVVTVITPYFVTNSISFCICQDPEHTALRYSQCR